MLARKRIRAFVIVSIAFTVTLVFHQLCRRVQHVFGRRFRPGLAGRRRCVPEPRIGGVGFRGERQIDHRLGQRQFAFGRPKPLIGVPGIKADALRLRIGQPYVFDRHAGDAARQITRIFAALQHPRQPVKRGVGVGPAHRFMQRADQIVMRVARFVVLRGAPTQPFAKANRVQWGRDLPGGDLFDQVQQRPTIAIGHLDQRCARCVGQGQRRGQLGLGAGHQLRQIGRPETFQDQHLRPAQKRRVQLERRVLRGGTDQHNGAVLHMRQKPVLLGFVEAVNFVDEQQRPLPCGPAQARRLEDFSEIGNPRENSADLNELQIGFIGQQARDGGLSHPRWTPEDQRRQGTLGQHHAKRSVRTQNQRLPHDLTNRFWPQPVCQRPRTLGGLVGRCVEQIGHGTTLTANGRGDQPRALV